MEKEVSWEYRVMRTKDAMGDAYTIAEVYYDEDDNITAVSAEPMYPMGLDVGELAMDLKYMVQALEKPVIEALDADTIHQPHETVQ